MDTDYDLSGKTIAVLATNGFEDSELASPVEAIGAAGADIVVVSETLDDIIGKNKTTIMVDQTLDDISAEEFDGLVLPGGLANPDKLRMNKLAVAFVRGFFDQHKPVAAICHAPWMLIEADVINGRKLTSWPSLKTDIINAGGQWVDEAVVVDQGLVTSRSPDDLADFNAKAIEEFAEGMYAEEEEAEMVKEI
ncbi:MAG: type 1 glutamine amidotransferase [bacterium]|nr:type 1 glutamine amidotransferase [bacterium]